MRILGATFVILVFAGAIFVLYRWIEGSAVHLEKGIKLNTAVPFSVPKTQTFNQSEFIFSQTTPQLTVLHFWATWCEPCIAELPELLNVTPYLKELGFQIVTVSEDSSWEDIEGFFKKYPQLKRIKTETQLILDLDRKISTLYRSEQFPETYVIGKDFKILSKFIGVQKWESAQMSAFFKKISKP